MRIENLKIKSVEEHITQTDEGDKKRWAVTMQNGNESTKVKIVFDAQPEQAFVPNDSFTLTLSNPQTRLRDEN
jgi:hypothetical protein